MPQLKVVQRRFYRLRHHYMYREACSALALPTGLQSLPTGLLRQHCHLPNGPSHSVLHGDDPGQNLGVYSSGENLEPVPSGTLCRHLDVAQRQWDIQHNNRFYHRLSADKRSLELATKAEE